MWFVVPERQRSCAWGVEHQDTMVTKNSNHLGLNEMAMPKFDKLKTFYFNSILGRQHK